MLMMRRLQRFHNARVQMLQRVYTTQQKSAKQSLFDSFSREWSWFNLLHVIGMLHCLKEIVIIFLLRAVYE